MNWKELQHTGVCLRNIHRNTSVAHFAHSLHRFARCAASRFRSLALRRSIPRVVVGWGGVWWGGVGCGGVVIHSRLVYIDFAYGLYNICISICI